MNNKNPNKLGDVQNKISGMVDAAGNPSLKGVGDLIGIAKDAQVDGLAYLRSMTNEIDKPIFKNFANDMINVLGSFYASEEVLCCLIKNLLLTAKVGQSISEYKQFIHENINGTEAEIPAELFKTSVEELGFIKTLDELIFIVDTIIIFVELDVEAFVLPILDFSKLISDAIIGMLIISMQEIVFTMRDSAIAWIINSISDNTGNQPWVKCLPFMDLVQILKRYIHDYGFLNKLFGMISGHLGQKFAKLSQAFDSEFPKNVKLLEFLKWLRNILIKMKNAAISWDFCVDLGMDTNIDDDEDDNSNNSMNAFLDKLINDSLNNSGTSSNKLNNLITDDNTILTNTGNDTRIDDTSSLDGSFRPPSNNEVNAFLRRYMGMSQDMADQLTGYSNRGDNIHGSQTDNPHSVNNDCGYIMSPQDIKSTIIDIIQRNRLG